MSRTWHKLKALKQGCGKEYWKSRLHKYGEVLGKYTKILTHRKERRASTKIVKEQEDSRCSCSECSETRSCKYAWDLYNTNGDCLAEK